MAKVVRKIPLYVQKARLREYHIKKEYDQRSKVKYPDCIGTFPECTDLTKGQKCDDCNNCPYFCKDSFENGGKKMSKKKAVKKDGREEKIEKMIENYKHLKPAARAWLKIYRSKGYLSDEQIKTVEKLEQGE